MRIRYILIVHIVTAVVCGLAGCTGRNGENLRDDKTEYIPKVNEVEVMTLSQTDFPRQLLSNGRLKAYTRSALAFRSNGTLSEINVKNGDLVNKGTRLAALDRQDLQIALESAGVTLQKAELDLYDFLAGQGYASRDTLSVPPAVLSMAKTRSGYSSALNAYAQAEYDYQGSILRSPFRGRVADVKLKRYEESGSEPFCVLVDDSVLEVEFTVMESEYSFLEKGLKVKVVPFAAESRTYTGQITDINPLVGENGQISVRASIRNDGALIDGMNVRVMVERTIPSMFVVPRSAVVIRDNLDVLFTCSDEGKAGWTYVNILYSNSTHLAVEANEERGSVLNEGDRVIISGNLNLADESSVTIKEKE